MTTLYGRVLLLGGCRLKVNASSSRRPNTPCSTQGNNNMRQHGTATVSTHENYATVALMHKAGGSQSRGMCGVCCTLAEHDSMTYAATADVHIT